MQSFKLNKSDYKIIIGYLIIATLWLLFRNYVEKYTFVEYIIDIPVFWLQTMILLFFSKFAIESFLIKNNNNFLIVIISFFGLWLIGYLTYLSGEFSRDGFLVWKSSKPTLKMIIYNINNSAVNLAIPLALISGKKYYEYQLHKLENDNAKKDLELMVLRSQFNPHFLYNSLNTIDALIDYSPKEEVKKYIANLAKLYRHLILNQEEDIVPLKDEIELANNFIYLLKTRFEDDYKFILQEKPLPKNKYLPNGSLLASIENCVKHNKPFKNKTITIYIIIDSDSVIISNTVIQSRIKTDSLGTGIKNLKKRYSLLSDKNIKIKKSHNLYELTLPLLNVIE